jgi:hypothetical protein
VAHEIKPKGFPVLHVVRAPGELDQTTALVPGPVARLGVAQVLAPLVGGVSPNPRKFRPCLTVQP